MSERMGLVETITLDSAELSREKLPLLELLEHVDHGIALTGCAGRIAWCNTLLAEVFLCGHSAADWVGRPYSEVFRPIFAEAEQWERVEAALARLCHAPKERIELEDLAVGRGACLRRIDLVLCQLESEAGERVANGEHTAGSQPGSGSINNAVAWYFYDQTAHRRAQENLEVLLRHTSDGIFLIDADCRLRVFNAACEKITGFRAEEVLHQEVSCSSLFPCFSPACAERRATPAVLPGTAPFCFRDSLSHETREMNIRTRDGRSVWVEISYAPVADRERRVAYVLGILRDVTQRRQLEEQLALTRKLATLGELTSAMAHEIKNPLGIIMSAAEIVGNPARPDEQRRQAAVFIREETKRLDERIQALLNFSRPRPPEFKSQDVHRVLEQTILSYETLAREGLRLKTRFARHLPEVHIDADQMQQVFLNLIMNADQAMPGGGTITITTRHKDGRVLVGIADEGPGLPEEDMGRLFEPFYSTKPRGTGLGLAIVMHIVTAHQGRIESHTRKGATRKDGGKGPGAEFIVNLPAVNQPGGNLPGGNLPAGNLPQAGPVN